MSRFLSLFSRLFIPLIFLVLFHINSAWAEHYDIAYIWDTNLESVLDYKEKLESVLPPDTRDKLIIVGRGNQYGVLYDQNGSAKRSAQIFVRQNVLLRKAGLEECYALKDQGYYRLYNVSYGVGPNLDVLKKTYKEVYSALGKEIGKNLFIEEIDDNAYALLYLRRGDIRTTYKIAREHAAILKRLGIKTTVIPENNDTIVYGESSHLDTADTSPSDDAAKEIDKKEPEQVQAHLAAAKKKLVVDNGGAPSDTTGKYVGHNSGFERNIKEFIDEQRRKGHLANDEVSGWMVFDLMQNESLVDINANQVFQAASMIKPFVALAFFHQVRQGKLSYSAESRRKMEAMIQRSSNNAANWVMRKVGGPSQCEAILMANYSSIFKGTHIREYIPANGRTYKNTAIPSDYIRFLQALWKKDLPYDSEIRRLMALPKRGRLYSGTPIPEGTLVYNKTGTTAHLCGDMGILVAHTQNGRQYPYALVGIIERRSRPSDYGRWMLTRGNIIRQVSTLVYEEMKRQHRLL